MSTTELEQLRYPVGRFDPSAAIDDARRQELIERIAALPAQLRRTVERLDDASLDVPYRPGGWTIRQVVHHVPDSHMNAYIRLKLALTETEPTIKPYEEAAWAKLPDSALPIGVSLQLLDAVHERFVVIWRSLGGGDWARTVRHPDMGTLTLDTLLQLYAWHGRHHLAHITGALERLRTPPR